MKYRKKPLMVDAVQFFRKNFIKNLRGREINEYSLMPIISAAGHFFLKTNDLNLIQPQQIFNGDWIVKNDNDEFDLVKPDIFEKNYERVEEDA